MSKDAQMTRCPCGTTFKVSEEQLNIASGAVRCGSCLQVFDAYTHFVSAEKLAFNDAPQAAPPTIQAENRQSRQESDRGSLSGSNTPFSLAASSSPIEEIEPHDESWAEELLKELEDESENDELIESFSSDSSELKQGDEEKKERLDLDSLLEDSVSEDELDLSFFDQELNNLKTSSQIESASADLGFKLDQEDHDADPLDIDLPEDEDLTKTAADLLTHDLVTEDNDPEDVTYIEDLDELYDDEPTEDPTKPFLAQADSLSDEQADTDREENLITNFDLDEEANQKSNDDSWAESMLEELSPNSEEQSLDSDLEAEFVTNQTGSIDSLMADQLDSSELIDDGNGSNSTFDTEEDGLDELTRDIDSDESQHSAAAKGAHAVDIDDIGYDLLANSRDQKSTTSAASLTWVGGIAASIFVIILQYMIFNFHDLALKPNYRPLYAKVCGVFGCTLPDRIALDKIVTNKLVVREHPEIADALLIDTIMVNEAPFSQPFPDMSIQFSDINGQTVAYRRFTPTEYKGDIKETKAPPHTPIHIALEIANPGNSAVNYAISFQSSISSGSDS